MINIMNISRTAQKGFTIVETLVAITILMIAIAGPLTIASQALHAAQDAKNQMIASNLAQESVEEIRNYKDNNIATQTLVQLFNHYTTANGGGLWYVETDVSNSGNSNGGYYSFGACSSTQGALCRLYLNPDQGYIYENTSGSVATPFYRSFSFLPVNDNEYLLTVTVSWTTGTVPNQVQIVDLLSAVSR